MLLSQDTELGWFLYSRKISNGLSNNASTKPGCGDVIFFVERLNEYARLSDDFLKIAKKMGDDEISFIRNNRDFLLTIK